MDAFRSERQVGLNTLFRGVGQDSRFFFLMQDGYFSEQVLIYSAQILFLSLFLSFVRQPLKGFFSEHSLYPVTLVSGSVLNARDTKMIKTWYWQCDNTLKYVPWRCPLLLLAFALPEGGLFLLEESGQVCSRWTEPCLRSSCCTSWEALTLASTCLTPASFSSEPSYFYAYIMGQSKCDGSS